MDEAAFAFQPHNETAESATEAGQQLYQDNCAYCHSVDASGFSTETDKIPELLRSGNIRSHSRLELSEDQINILDKYLKSLK